MSGSIYQGATELSFGERDNLATVTFLRSGDLSGAVEVEFDVTTESATPGEDFLGSSGTVRFEPGQDRANVTFELLDDAQGEPTETFAVSLVSVDGGTLSVPRTCRVNILDDETPILPPSSPPFVSDYRVNTQPIVTGLSQPTNVEFTSADLGLAYVAEKGGRIRVFDMETGADKGTFIDLRSQVNNYGDRGLLDIVLHPDFQSQPYLYAYYVVDPPGTPETMSDKAGNRYAQVVRFEADADSGYTRVVPGSGMVIAGNTGTSLDDINGGGSLDFSRSVYASHPSSERYLNPGDPTPPLVIDGIKQDYIKVDSLTHAGGALAFGPDGQLYISTGDGASPNYADPHTLDVQNLNSLSGKILRVDPMTGQGLTDNPFHQDGQSLDSNISKVFQYGLRNPFSIAFDSLGQLFITDTGWNAFEEVNSGEAGANFGWPWYEGREGGRLGKTNGYSTRPEAAEFYQGVEDGTILVKPPYAAFAHAAGVAGFQNQAITGSSFILGGDRYPADLKDNYIFTDFTSGRVFSVDTRDRLDVEYLYKSSGAYAPVHFAQGPDGYVYYVEYGDYAPTSGTASSNGGFGRLLIFPGDGPLVSVATSGSATEGAAGGATLTFSLNAAQAGPVTLTYSTANGTALAGSDFTGRTNATVVIPAGQTSASVTIPLVNDAVLEPTETFSVVLNGATLGGAPIATGSAATVTILDNDAPPPTQSPYPGPGAPVLAAGGMLTVDASNYDQGGQGIAYNDQAGLQGGTNGGRAGSDVEQSADGDINFVKSGEWLEYTINIAEAGTYDLDLLLSTNGGSGRSATVNFYRPGEAAPYATSGSIANPVTGSWTNFQTRSADGIELDAGTQVVRVTFAGGSQDFRSLSLEQADDGPPAAHVTVAAARASYTEGTDGAATLVFSLNAAQAGPVTVTYSTANGTALAGSDFTGRTNATVVIPAGQTSVSVTIPLVNDAAPEASETFSVVLNGATLGGAPIATGSAATVTILDNDAPPSGVNLLVNGSFEASAVPAGGFAAYTSVSGWTAVAGGRIELWNALNGVTATDGTDFVELDYRGALDGFYQDVQTSAGQVYDLGFDLRLRPGTPASTQGVQVLWNGAVVATTTPGAAWAPFGVEVTGTGGSDRLTIREVSGQSGDGLGALLDDFSLTASSGSAAAAMAASADAGAEPGAATLGASDEFVFSSPSGRALADGEVVANAAAANAAAAGLLQVADAILKAAHAGSLPALASHADALTADDFLFG